MAYSYTVTKNKASADGELHIIVVESGNATTDLFEIEVPTAGRIIRWKCINNKSPSTNMQPLLAEESTGAAWSASNLPSDTSLESVFMFSSAAVTCDEQPNVSPVYYTSSGKLYGKSGLAITTSESVTHHIFLRPTWER
tara:strand:- start:6207 stop:6623 length:417 start_codon:yes stop_codon:yes gene_type:complete